VISTRDRVPAPGLEFETSLEKSLNFRKLKKSELFSKKSGRP